MMGRFLTELDVKRLPDKNGRKQWRLLSPLIYQSSTVGTINVPIGFITDFASVPRLPFIYWLFGGCGDEEGVLHDFLHTKPHITGCVKVVEGIPVAVVVDRATSDKVLRGARYANSRIDMNEFELVTIINIAKNIWAYFGAWCFWAAVRLGGWRYWEE